MQQTLLICDDEKNIRDGLALAFQDEGFQTLTASSGDEAWALIGRNDVDLLITDLRMEGMSGEELLQKVHGAYPRLPVIILTGHGTIETAVVAMRDGAVDFFPKPVDLDRLILVVRKSLSTNKLYEEHERLKSELAEIKARTKYGKIIGKSQKMMALMELVGQVAPSRASVLITGESGVGKELVATAIQELSDRADKPFIKVNSGGLSETLLEDRLFGHEKGAFTGAISMHKGYFEQADGGTLFLDEIGEIPLSTQVKLLRAIQERTFERLGGEKSMQVDVRFICATNRDLAEEVRKGTFREDLFYRLNVIHLEVPPLRERKEDIPLLMASFLDTFNRENNKHIEGFSDEAKRAMFGYDWPGNIRELRNAVESAVVLCRTQVIGPDDLPPAVTKSKDGMQVSIPVGVTLDEGEKRLIVSTLDYCKGNKTKAAEVLGIGRKTLHRKLQEYKIEDGDDA